MKNERKKKKQSETVEKNERKGSKKEREKRGKTKSIALLKCLFKIQFAFPC